MKKIYVSFLSLLTVFTASAQLTQANHAPAAGDTYAMYRCDSVNINPGTAGAGSVWNFAASTTYSNLIRNYAVQAVTSSSYPSANVGVASAVNDVSYLNSSAGALVYYGGNISVGTIAGSLTYTSPAVFASYPMSLNTSSTSSIGGSVNITVPFPTTGTFLGSSMVVADGTGTINLPGGLTFSNTIRVLTTQTINITTAFASAVVTQMTYDYFVSGIKASVFSITTSTANVAGSPTTQTFVTRNKNAVVAPPTNTNTVGLDENTANTSNFSVFPNPSNTFVNFVTNHPDAKVVAVYDITGKLVEKQILNEGKVKVDVSSFNKGLYLYTVSAGDNRTLKSGKITVSQ